MYRQILKATCNPSGETSNNHDFDLGEFVSKNTVKNFTIQDIFEDEYTKEEIQYNTKFPLLGCLIISLLLSPYLGAFILLSYSVFILFISTSFACLVVAALFLEAFAIQKPIVAKIGLCATAFILIFEIFLMVCKI